MVTSTGKLFLLLLLFNPVIGLQVNPCQGLISQQFVINDSLSLNKSGSAASFSYVTIVKPGIAQVFSYINCDLLGEYELSFFNETMNLSVVPSELRVFPEASHLSACEGTNLSIPFIISSPFNESTVFNLSTGNSVNFSGIARVLVNEFLPYGVSSDLVSLSALGVGFFAQASTKVSILPLSACEAVRLSGPRHASMINESFYIPLTVRNIGSLPTSYNVLVSGSAVNGLNISTNFLTLEPGESQRLDLSLSERGSLIVEVLSIDGEASDYYSVIVGDLTNWLLFGLLSSLLVIFLARWKLFKNK